jgi:hypothetical protein
MAGAPTGTVLPSAAAPACSPQPPALFPTWSCPGSACLPAFLSQLACASCMAAVRRLLVRGAPASQASRAIDSPPLFQLNPTAALVPRSAPY